MLYYECRKVDFESADEYPGAQGNSGLWRRCKTPKSMTCAQSPVKQESLLASVGSPRPITAWGDVTNLARFNERFELGWQIWVETSFLGREYSRNERICLYPRLPT